MKKRILFLTLFVLLLPLLFSDVGGGQQTPSSPFNLVALAQGDPPPVCPMPPCPRGQSAGSISDFNSGQHRKPNESKTAELGSGILLLSSIAMLMRRLRA